MTKAQLLKRLLPGFVPLFVFIAADEIWGTKIGLFVAVAVGLTEMIWVATREKRFDSFILFDTLLLVALGGVSILLDNDIFFKLKPGFIELILVVILAVSAFSKVNIVGMMGQRYLKEVSLNDNQMVQMRNSLKTMFFLFGAHTILVFYAAFFMSKTAWAFISGGLFYILFGVVFLFEFIRLKMKKQTENSTITEEWVPLVNDSGSVTGNAPRSQVHNGSKLLHPVVHMHVLNKNKAILLQKRPMSKQIQPGKWDTAVGGHISAGESLEQALKKESREEIGLQEFSAKHLKFYRWDCDAESELVYLFITYDHKDFKPQSEEVEELRFWTKNQIEKQLGNGVFTPNFELEFGILKEMKIL